MRVRLEEAGEEAGDEGAGHGGAIPGGIASSGDGRDDGDARGDEVDLLAGAGEPCDEEIAGPVFSDVLAMRGGCGEGVGVAESGDGDDLIEAGGIEDAAGGIARGGDQDQSGGACPGDGFVESLVEGRGSEGEVDDVHAVVDAPVEGAHQFGDSGVGEDFESEDLHAGSGGSHDADLVVEGAANAGDMGSVSAVVLIPGSRGIGARVEVVSAGRFEIGMLGPETGIDDGDADRVSRGLGLGVVEAHDLEAPGGDLTVEVLQGIEDDGVVAIRGWGQSGTFDIDAPEAIGRFDDEAAEGFGGLGEERQGDLAPGIR